MGSDIQTQATILLMKVSLIVCRTNDGPSVTPLAISRFKQLLPIKLMVHAMVRQRFDGLSVWPSLMSKIYLIFLNIR